MMPTSARTHASRGSDGFILVVVLVFAMLLVATLATFLRRATVDSFVVRHRDAAAEAEAAARGGVQLAIALLLEDRIEEQKEGFRSESTLDPWARMSGIDIPLDDEGATLRLSIADAGARLNLNALIDAKGVRQYSEIFLTELLKHVTEDADTGNSRSRVEDVDTLAQNLLDWLDPDDVRIRGGSEDDVYAKRDTPTKAANRPLLSLDELRQVEGFDADLVDALRPYVTVFPYGRADGINLNTAPPHVLSLLYHGVGGDFRLADEDTVKGVLKVREDGGVLCPDESSSPICTPVKDVVPGEIFPPPTWTSDVFLVRAEARIGEVRRTIETVVDRSKPSETALLLWRVR